MSIGFDGASASRGLDGLNRRVDDIRDNSMRLGSGLNKDVANFGTQMSGLDKQFTLWERNSGEFASTMEKKQRQIELVTSKSALLENEINSVTGELIGSTREFGENSEAAGRLQNQLLDLKIQQADYNRELQRLNSFDWDAFNRIGQGFTNVGKNMSLAVTAPIVAIGGSSLNTFIQLEDSFARVQKVTSGTKEELAEVRSQLRYLATDGGIPLAITDMYELGTAAGRVGIELENMSLAVSTAAMLGTVTDLTADSAMDQMAQFSTVMQMPQENFDRLGSTLVGLGNNMATTENQIMRMGARLTGMGNAVGLSEAEVLGFSAAFSSLGINAEAGGTALTTIMLGMQNIIDTGADQVEYFAMVAGKSVEEFSELFKRDAAGAFIYMVEGLGRLNDEGYNTTQILSAMGFEGINVTDMLRRGAGAGDTLRSAIDLANTSWEENTALTEAAGKIYDTTASELQILRNRFTIFKDTIGSDLQHQFRALISLGDRTLQWFNDMDDGTRRTIITVGMFAASIGPVLLGIGGAITMIGKMRDTVVTLKSGFINMKSIFATGGKAIGFFTSPVGIAIIAIGALIAVGIALWKNWDEVTTWIGNSLDFLEERFPFAFGIASDVVDIFGDTARNVIDNTKQVFGGIIDFVAGVFTGDWSRAWTGVVNIFGGIFGTLGSLIKAPMNAVISIVNRAIGGINSISVDIPDWVPFVGGRNFGLTIPEIPMLAKGTNFHRGGPAIVGEKGPELVNLPRGSKVIPNDETNRLLAGIGLNFQEMKLAAAIKGIMPRDLSFENKAKSPSSSPRGQTNMLLGCKNRSQNENRYNINKFAETGTSNKNQAKTSLPTEIKVIIQKLVIGGDTDLSENRLTQLKEELKTLFEDVFGELWEEEWYKLSLKYPNITEA